VDVAQTGDASFYSIIPLVTPGEMLSQTLRMRSVADSLKTQFRPVTDPSAPTIIEMVGVVLRSYFMSPASDPKLTKHDEVQDVVRRVKVTKTPGLRVYRKGP
jgi:hypothetical protein